MQAKNEQIFWKYSVKFSHFYPAKLFVRKEDKVKAFANMQKQRKFTIHIVLLKELLKNVLQKNDKLTQKKVVGIKKQ